MVTGHRIKGRLGRHGTPALLGALAAVAVGVVVGVTGGRVDAYQNSETPPNQPAPTQSLPIEIEPGNWPTSTNGPTNQSEWGNMESASPSPDQPTAP